MKLVGRRYDTEEMIALTLELGVVKAVTAVDDPAAPWLAPGFIDLQVNGYGGLEFNDPELTVAKVEQMMTAFDPFGVARLSPTTTTAGYDLLHHALTVLAQAKAESPKVAQRWAGIHVEGPYISSEDGPRGAHPLAHCRAPDWDEFQRLQEAAQGEIRLLTLSPEYDNAPDFIRQATATGVRIAIGHTGANSEQIRAAVDAGATLSTHLGNGSHGIIRRHPNYIWDQLAEDRLVASLIVDGHHLPREVVQSLVRGKTPERCILVSDITSMGGLPPGYYKTGLGAVEVLENGKPVVAGQREYLAGAALPIHVNIAKVMDFAGVDLKTAIEMATSRPAEYIGCDYGRFTPGAPADFVLFDQDADPTQPLHIRTNVLGGEVVYQAS
ncbi:N-acetylglucosamine-6-phosphate deacetylase [Lignipirellula cremea]|uniref:N-acetylglucosamine-6-phosphate deacetylase n=1 Tax=Lignipirellula cremea TaxID=2528010 RepID=A0A518E0Y5_9BACT|nr:amidohydrolase family protein [Lignipirellula cremea]QDU97750.1 N-acetylglucosamine-6-phosphate deacetylase [Lignipirellula cremea]